MSTADPNAGRSQILDVQQVAEVLDVDRQWVYDHAAELGAFKLGEGCKARLGFERASIAAPDFIPGAC